MILNDVYCKLYILHYNIVNVCIGSRKLDRKVFLAILGRRRLTKFKFCNTYMFALLVTDICGVNSVKYLARSLAVLNPV